MNTKIALNVTNLTLHNLTAEQVEYQGRPAVRILESAERQPGFALAVLTDSHFQNGTLEVELAGLPRAGADVDARGFVGLAFRVQATGYECFYLRPTNGRANDQLRRNHSTQYMSMPDYPWHRLRQENPGVYESYTDLVTGAWTQMRIVVEGIHAQLYVNHAEQPCLIVNDLKRGEGAGQVALWIGAQTEAYFAAVRQF